MTARRRSASASSAGSPALSAAAIAPSYDAMASAMRAARSCARASWSRSAAGRTGVRGPVCIESLCSVAVTVTSLGDGVVGEVVEPAGHLHREEVIQRQDVAEDGQRIGGIRDPFGQELAGQG